MKRFICVFLAVLTVFFCVSCGKDERGLPDYDNLSFEAVDKSVGCTPLLYKVTGGKGGVLYLLGSIHVGDERTQTMPDYIMDAYNGSDYICVEADIVAYEQDIMKLMADLQLMLCEKNKTIRDHLDPQLYADMKKFLQSTGKYNASYELYRPTLWSSLVDEAIRSYTELETEYGVDRYFINKANEDGKEIIEVESVDFQNNLMLGFSDELYSLLIAESVYYPEEGVNGLNSMYEIWLGGDEAELEEMLKLDYTGLSDEERKLVEEYNTKMLTERNVGMADKAEEYLSTEGTGFYIVGTAHIVGDGALVELLRDRGYTVEVVK